MMLEKLTNIDSAIIVIAVKYGEIDFVNRYISKIKQLIIDAAGDNIEALAMINKHFG